MNKRHRKTYMNIKCSYLSAFLICHFARSCAMPAQYMEGERCTFSLCKLSIALLQNLREQKDSSGSSVRLRTGQTGPLTGKVMKMEVDIR